jgi:hypothetical protein
MQAVKKSVRREITSEKIRVTKRIRSIEAFIYISHMCTLWSLVHEKKLAAINGPVIATN